MFEQKFTELLLNNPAALTNRKMFVSLLKDYFLEDSLKVNLLCTLYDIDIAEEIEALDEISNTFAYKFVKRLMNDYGTTRLNADWAVSIWCVCYGKNVLGKPCDFNVTEERKGPSIENETSSGVVQYKDLFKFESGREGYVISEYMGDEDRTVILINEYMKHPVTEIKAAAFENTGVEEVIMTEGYRRINKAAFKNCYKLRGFVFSPTLKEIGAEVFSGDEKLGIVSLPVGLEEIGERAFEHSGLKKIQIPNTVYKIGEGAFSSCAELKDILLSENATELPDRFLMGCKSLMKIKLPDSLTKIGRDAFRDCTELDFIVIPDKVNFIGENAFHNTHKKFLIQCSAGSYAEEYARNNKIKYQLV